MKKRSWITNKIIVEAVKEAFMKLNPINMVKNPVMFVVEVGFVITFILTIFPTAIEKNGNALYNAIVTIILFITLLFANFAEAIAEGRGKAQAETMKKTRQDTPAKLVMKDGNFKIVSAGQIELPRKLKGNKL